MINENLLLGEINTLKVTKATSHGLYLSSIDEESVLLPKRYVQNEKIGDILDVFIYNDSEDRYVATKEKPEYIYGDFGVFEVVEVSHFGYFVDWGMEKDLFLPFSKSNRKIKKGDKIVGKIIYDEKTDRLILDAKIGKYLKKPVNLKRNDKVNILIIAKTPLGYKCIVEKSYEGMLFENEIFEKIQIGHKKEAFIKNIRNDGKIDLSLYRIKDKNFTKEKVYGVLKEWGEIPVTTKSSPQEIQKYFGISKKAFKSAVNLLKEEKKADIINGRLKLLKA